VRVDWPKEIRQLIIFSLFIIVLPLVVFNIFPQFRIQQTGFILLAFELVWYTIILFFLLPQAAAPVVILSAIVTLVYRVAIGLVFSLFLFIMFSLNLKEGIPLGIAFYLPSFIFQAILAPFILRPCLKGIWGLTILPSRPAGRVFGEGKSATFMEEIKQRFPDEFPAPGKVEFEGVGIENALSYVKEYTGVEGVLLIDHSGLIVAKNILPSLNEDEIAPFVATLKEANNKNLNKIKEKEIERLELFTQERWISLHQIYSFILVSIASRNTDELLNVRLHKAKEIIQKSLEEKYSKAILLGLEE
jgi:predicted regulator of Ras-like GTPase activity (Roadblock/LC7/MglB family)